MAPILCVPIVHQDFLGAIRCTGRIKSPWSFDDRDQRMLELAASFVGGWWVDQLDYVELQKDSEQFKGLVNSVTNLHKSAGRLLASEAKSVQNLLKETLIAAMSAISGVDHGSIRLVNAERQELYYEVTEGPLWKKGSEREVAARKAKTFPLNRYDSPSPGTYVVNQEAPRIVNAPESDPRDALGLRDCIGSA